MTRILRLAWHASRAAVVRTADLARRAPHGVQHRLVATVALNLLLGFGLLFNVRSAMAIEQPKFTLIEQDGSFELRAYAPYLIAETRVEADFEEAGSIAFQRLFDYISGNNTSQSKVAMTAPVTQSSAGAKIAMTAPVSQSAEGRGYRVGFIVPSQYTIETVPKPNDARIEIVQVPARKIAVWRYSGRWTDSNYREAQSALQQAMKRRGLLAQGSPILARYDPPFMPAFLRRNEVMITVAEPGNNTLAPAR